MIVVADTTPLISLLKIRHFDILRSLYGEIHIPQAVYDELTANADFADEVESIANCDFLRLHSDIPADRVDILRRATGLDLGESEAIILADMSDTKALLIDEAHGRKVAEQMRLPVTGVIGVLMAAFKKSLLTADEIRESVAVMRSANRFISEGLYKLLFDLLEN